MTIDITLFTDTVRCHSCNQVDMYNGLKKRNDRWYCRKCLQQEEPPKII